MNTVEVSLNLRLDFVPLTLTRHTEYLGFEIRTTALEDLVAVPAFRAEREVELTAATMPLLRKRIWQWWYMAEMHAN